MNSFTPLVPDGWLKDYLGAMERAHNEMPAPFHFLAGAAVVGNMIGLSAWATLNKGVRIYPNINALLLSPAGKCRRGEGTKITMKIAVRAGVNVLSGKATPEALMDDLLENPNLVFYVEELAMLLTKQDTQMHMTPTLTKLLLHGDGEVTMRTRMMGERRTLTNPNLTAVFTCAPDWFVHSIPEAAYGGGLMSRFIPCCLNDRTVYHIDIQADDVAGGMVDELAEGLKQVRGVLRGHLRGTDAAQRWIDEWYVINESTKVEDERFLPHLNRKPANLLRVAMILCAAAGTGELSRTKLEEALEIINWIEPTLLELYGATDVLLNSMTKGERRILTYLTKHREALHSDLARACAPYFRGGTAEMRKCLMGLVEKCRVEAVGSRRAGHTWPPKVWRIAND